MKLLKIFFILRQERTNVDNVLKFLTWFIIARIFWKFLFYLVSMPSYVEFHSLKVSTVIFNNL